MTKITDTETALALFEEAAIKHGEATEQSDYKTGNRNYYIIEKAASYLQKESNSVKVWAAAYLLTISEKEAIEVLERISQGVGIVSFGAETTLSEWRKGNLKMRFK